MCQCILAIVSLFVLVFNSRALLKVHPKPQVFDHKEDDAPDFGHGRGGVLLGKDSRAMKGDLKEPVFTSLLWDPVCILNNIINLILPSNFQNLCRNSIVQIIIQFIGFGLLQALLFSRLSCGPSTAA